jgi:nitroreductase
LQQILEAGRQAPSAANRQPIRFVVVTDHEMLKNLCDSVITRFVKAAPVAIAGCADVKSFLTGKWAVVDTTIAMQNMVIAAWALGIGSCWIGACKEEKVRKLLKIPDKWKFVGLLTLAIPQSNRSRERRKSLRNCLTSTVFKVNTSRVLLILQLISDSIPVRNTLIASVTAFFLLLPEFLFTFFKQ